MGRTGGACLRLADRARMQRDQPMPLVHISMRAGKPEAYRQAILDGLYRAMREALNVPDGDQFMTINEVEAANFRCGSAYGVNRSDDAVMIQITVFASRTAEQKKALYRRIADLLGDNPGIRPEDVFVNVLDAPAENWSVGNGVAQFA
jgi:phenylpyruvate tautomerase PptA (4-oxalocrotonate tautomerase family)